MKTKSLYRDFHKNMDRGALKSPDDPSDWIFEHLAQGPPGTYAKEFPDEFDLRRHSMPVRNQGTRGTCAAFTAATIKEIQENRETAFFEYMSPEFIYYHRQNKPSDGMYGRNVFQILQKVGTVPESMYPYTEDGNLEPPNKKLYEHASQYKIANFAKVTTIDGLKRALLELGPCYLLLPLYSTNEKFWQGDDKKCSSGHAVTVIGYNTEGFILQNSWGVEWNNGGYVIFPYDEWHSQWECWVAIDAKFEKVVLSEVKKVKSKRTKTAKNKKYNCLVM
ncbi:Peptidase C1A (papain) [Pacmanvirus A23]|uniref:Peptidase C1A (papain) n=1 Tax=Pacmanvirus A23 TaxID=1932881 RepID=UPI000A092A7C|nr:Peptidase C1A (papain) [Pacmanvirus A23]SIP85989.1 Peptidase C1A (papain) [Pacmanvirus A23]